jgi:exonuclease III
MTYNIGAIDLNVDKKRKLLLQFIKDNKIDIECYQEVKMQNINSGDYTSEIVCNARRTGKFGVNTINFNRVKLEETFNILTNREILNNGFELCNPKTKEKYARNGKCVNILELEFKKKQKKTTYLQCTFRCITR